MIIGNFTDFFAKFSRNTGDFPAKTETDVKSMSKNAPVAKDAKNETGIRFSVFYESNSKKGTSYIYKEGIPHARSGECDRRGVRHAPESGDTKPIPQYPRATRPLWH